MDVKYKCEESSREWLAGFMRDEYLLEKVCERSKLDLEPTLYGLYIYLEFS